MAVLGYWNCRGLAEPIRYLLHYLGIEFEDKRYEFGPEPHYLDCTWINNDKHQMGLKFPNLPYYIDGNVKLTQSVVIMRYLARKCGTLYTPSDNETELVTFETVEGHVRDIYSDLALMSHSPLFEHERIMFAHKFRDKIEVIADFLDHKPWLMGDVISHVDFILYEALDVLEVVYPDICGEFGNLVTLREQFSQLPGVKGYLENSQKWPIFTAFAFFGGSGGVADELGCEIAVDSMLDRTGCEIAVDSMLDRTGCEIAVESSSEKIGCEIAVNSSPDVSGCEIAVDSMLDSG